MAESRFKDMGGLEEQDRARDEYLKQREFNGFIRDLATYCFSDCVHDFSANQLRQTPSEQECVSNCIH
jgi:hypothetical protein